MTQNQNPMTAPEIPAKIIEAADLALAHDCVEVEVSTGTTKCVCPTDEHIRTILAAAWPLIAAHVVEHDGDGYHTHAELYRYRMLYNAHATKAWADQGTVVKSWKHSDGEPCFGGGWFVVVANLHPFGQVSNHYEAEHWDLFDVPEVDLAPTWDGHTPAAAADRLEAALRAHTPTDPTEPRP